MITKRNDMKDDADDVYKLKCITLSQSDGLTNLVNKQTRCKNVFIVFFQSI